MGFSYDLRLIFISLWILPFFSLLFHVFVRTGFVSDSVLPVLSGPFGHLYDTIIRMYVSLLRVSICVFLRRVFVHHVL